MILVLMFVVASATAEGRLHFRSDGTFKILQVADMHYADGKATPCKDVYASQMHSCSDVNTTIFVKRLLEKEKPDFVVFTGDNIDFDATDAIASMNAAFAPVIKQKSPWAAVLGNHDQESNLPRDKVMQHIADMDFSLSEVHPESSPVEQLYGFGNFHHSVFGPQGTSAENQSLLNLYFLDSGDYSKVKAVDGYDWIRANQQVWFQNLSSTLKKSGREPVPALAFFHIPLPEYETVLHGCSIHGQHQEQVCSPSLNSGFFSTLVEAGDVKAAFVGHDHVNDYCGHLMGVQLCYGGAAGYHAYGKAGWARRARLILSSLTDQKQRVRSISTWKRLDDLKMSIKDSQILWDAFNNVGAAGTCRFFTALFSFYETQSGFMMLIGGFITLVVILATAVVVLLVKLNKLKARYVFISGSKK